MGKNRSLIGLYLSATALVTVYVIVYVNTPITIYANAMHDDGLFIALGRYLAEGQWLGPYNQHTLAKGPGYPAFLAISSWLGISVAMAHALFHAGTVTAFVAICHRFVKSVTISAILFVLLLWDPILFSGGLLRTFREPIYHGQVLIFIAAFACALLIADSKRRIFYAVLAGLCLGSLWLTREEGAWVIPAAALLTAAGLLQAYGNRSYRPVVGALLITMAVFATTQAGFRGLNWWNYGKFVGAEFKEANFASAVQQLQSVRSGGVKPLVSVTRGAREQIYPVSPAFASIKVFLEGATAWEQVGCKIIPVTCGEFSAGIFVWVLRDAAAAAGYHKTPRDAADFYGRVAREVSAACASGALECSRQLVPLMPQASWEQLSEFPRRLVNALRFVFLTPLSVDAGPSWGNEELFERSLRFLNHPVHTKNSDIPARLAEFPPERRQMFSRGVRTIVIDYYNVILLPILAAGLVLFAAASLKYWRVAAFNLSYVLAGAAWLLVVSRVGLIVLLEITAFPTALNLPYLMSAHFLTICAAAFSIAAWLQMSSRQPSWQNYLSKAAAPKSISAGTPLKV
jgi:hypothetical protein